MKKILILIKILTLIQTQDLPPLKEIPPQEIFITGQKEFIPEIVEIKDSKKDYYGYPTKVFIKANKFVDIAKKYPTSVVFYGYKTGDPRIMDAPSERILIIKIESFWTNFFVGIQFYLSGWPVNGEISIKKALLQRDLEVLKDAYGIENISEDFYKYYPDFDKDFKNM